MAGVDYDVIIMGSVVGGFTCGALLSKEGMKVLVFEQSDRIGGCCSNYNVDGFQPDVGAISVIGREMYDMVFGDGTRVLLPRDIDEMAEAVRSISPRDVDGYYRYCRDMQKIMDFYLSALSVPMPELKDAGSFSFLARKLARKEQLAALSVNLRLETRTLDKVVKEYFTDDRVQMVFGWENLYAMLHPRADVIPWAQ